MKLLIATSLFLLLNSANAISVWETLGSHIRSRPAISLDLESLGSATLDYKGGNHPFERRLQDLLESTNLEYDDEPSTVAETGPLRIKFITEPIEQRRGESPETDAMIDNILNNVLPAVSATWSKHLNVFPVSSPILVQEDVCAGALDDLIPITLQTVGVSNADVVIFVTGKDILNVDGNPLPVCFGRTLAVATACVLDQFDRPIGGLMNFCLPNDNVPIATTGEANDSSVMGSNETEVIRISESETIMSILLATHEIGHVLGVSSQLYPLFRDSLTGEPLTPRPLKARPVQCVDGSIRNVTFASEQILRLGETVRGEFYYDMVTPRVQQVVRNHYNCQSLHGPRLENQPTIDSCSGQHFDERTLYNELMTAIVSVGSLVVLSPITLALLEDSGWYYVDYEGVMDSTFGFGSGCDFVNSDCIVDNKLPSFSQGDFCDTLSTLTPAGQILLEDNEVLCNPSHVGFAACDLFDADQTRAILPDLTDSNRYFTDHPTWQPLQPQYDGCPIPGVTLGPDCRDPTTALLVGRYMGDDYGSTSRCVNVARQDETKFAGCFSTLCDEVTRRAVVAGHKCDFDGQQFEITATTGEGAIAICPKMSTVCPQFHCQSGCSGRGVCKFETAQCECFDAENKSPICSILMSNKETNPSHSSLAPATPPSSPPLASTWTPSGGIMLQSGTGRLGAALTVVTLQILLW